MTMQTERQGAVALAVAPARSGAAGPATTLLLIIAMALALLASVAQPSRAQTAGPASFADLVDEVGDAVVNITTTSLVATGTGSGPQRPAQHVCPFGHAKPPETVLYARP